MKTNDFRITTSAGQLCTEKGVPLTNFSIRAVRLCCDQEDQSQILALQITVHHLNRDVNLLIDVHAGSLTGQILREIPTCKLLQASRSAAIDAYIIALGEKGAQISRPIYLYQHGLCRLGNGSWIYVAGDEVLGMPDGMEYEFSKALLRVHLAWDPTCSATNAVNALCQRLERIDGILMPIWAFTIFSSLRSSIAALNLTTLPTLAILGGQNLGKTTLAQRYMLLYSDNNRPGRCVAQVDAHSTAAATIEQVVKFRDQVVLIDDMAKSAAASEEQARRNLIAELLRFASNDVDRVKMSPSKRSETRFCQAGVAFTGEFWLHNPSDLSRMIVVEIQEQMHGGDPTERTVAATVFRYLMLWLLPRLDEELKQLRQALDGVAEGDNIRLRKNRMVLLWALRVFYDFACDVGAVNKRYAAQAISRAGEVLDGLLDRQIREIERSKQKIPGGNLSWYVLTGYRKGLFHVVDRKDLRSNADCLVERDALCICGDTLIWFFRKQTPYRSLTKKEMNRRLIEEGALSRGREERSAGKRIKGRRYLELSFSALEQAQRAYGLHI